MTINTLSMMLKATVLAPFMEYGLIGQPQCISLLDIFKQPILQRNVNSEIVASDGTIGTGFQTGDLNLWSNNTLSIGGNYRDTVGKSSGACILLPGSSEWQCVFELNFNSGGSVSISGISNNSNEPRALAITGGTRCYEGASGTIKMTALNINSPFDAYRYELIS